MVAHQHKGLGVPQRTQAGRERYLRGLVDNAIVECASGEQRVVNAESSCCHYLGSEVALLQLGDAFRYVAA